MTFTIVTFGCKVNSYETEAVKEMMIKASFEYVKNYKDADIVLFNTCSVTRVSEKKCLTKIRSLNANYKDKIACCFGCFSQLHPEELAQLENVKVIIGNRKKDKLVDYINKYLETRERIIDVKSNLRQEIYEELKISSFSSEVRAFMKIQDGCDNFCSYCVIPFTRGKSCSRKREDVLLEVEKLAKKGYREIVLSGVDIGSYKDGEDYRFIDLIKDILNVEPKSFRLRISSLESSQISDELISIMKNDNRLVNHLHIPLQSGSQKILGLMNRKYDLNYFKELTKKLKREVPNIALSTDVIVGFPSESDDDFKDTYDFIKEVGFMRVHVFPYSARPFTLASKMKEQVSRECSKNRVRILTDLSSRLAREYFENNLSKSLEVLLEEELPSEDGYLIFRGYSQNYIDIKVRTKENLLGKVVKVVLLDQEIQEVDSII